jgi:thiamine-monophosphate kinase
MRLKDLGERRVISRIRRLSQKKRTDIMLGIGDDTAIVRGPRVLLITNDLMAEGVDFRRAFHPPRLLGRKSLNINLSDIAAMGGRPLHAVLGLALPGDTDEKWLDEFLKGFLAAARASGVALVGGDISASREIIISVTVTGEAEAFVPRSGAKPGDHLFVSGTLGDAAMGLRLLEQGLKPEKDKRDSRLFRAFLDPSPRLELGALLARRKFASAMIDISDGLSVDMAHLCEESRVGAEIESSRVPLSAPLKRAAKNPLAAALDGGEDFELLFTVRPRNVPRVLELGRRFKLTEIGRITTGTKIMAVDSAGRKKPLKIRGYEHFK